MKEIEELLRRDRALGIPEPPDVSFTVRAVQRRLGEQTPAPGAPVEWGLMFAAVGVLVGAAATAVGLGLHPLWLMAVPLWALILCPILLRKGA